jgi:hypothetical protein
MTVAAGLLRQKNNIGFLWRICGALSTPRSKLSWLDDEGNTMDSVKLQQILAELPSPR